MQLDFRVYRRPFRRSLQTHHGTWAVREGIIVKLTDVDGRVGLGEIAPLPNFGSETLEDAMALCQSWPHPVRWEDIRAIPSTHPASQFGLESAWEMLQSSKNRFDGSGVDTAAAHDYCCLLPTGSAAQMAWQQPYDRGDRTFKWKIGVAPISEEMEGFENLVQTLPSDVRLRLDANGGLTLDEAQRWLSVCDRLLDTDSAQVEFLEQPQPPAQFDDMLALSRQYRTAIALDESVATLTQLQTCYQRGWRGPVVIKAAIAGFPSALRRWCQSVDADVVWSSVFETAIARQFILTRLVPTVPQRGRALGFGVTQWFADEGANSSQFDATLLFDDA